MCLFGSHRRPTTRVPLARVFRQTEQQQSAPKLGLPRVPPTNVKTLSLVSSTLKYQTKHKEDCIPASGCACVQPSRPTPTCANNWLAKVAFWSEKLPIGRA